MLHRKVIRDHEDARKINDAQIPDIEKVLQAKKLKIVVKMSNIKFNSTNDVFAKGHDPERFLTEHEKKEL